MKHAWLVLLLAWLPAMASAQSAAASLAPPTPPASHPGPHHDDPSQFALDLDAMTMLPLVVGAVAGFEVPGHVVFRAGGGVVPSAYVDAINSVGIGWGAYGTDAAQMASLLLNDALFLEFGLGLRPAGTPGIELAVSYAMLWSHRSFDMAQLGATGRGGLDVTIDAIHGEVAWQTQPIEHVYFRIALGWVHAFDHHVSIASSGDEATQRAMQAAADSLAATIGRYAFGPTLGAALGLHF